VRIPSILLLIVTLIVAGCSPAGGGRRSSSSGGDAATTSDGTGTDDTTDTGTGVTTGTGDDTTATGDDTGAVTGDTGSGTGGVADEGEPCTSASDCADELKCLKDADGDFVCTAENEDTGDGTGDGTTTGDETGDCDKPPPQGASCNPYCNLGCLDGEHCSYSGGAFICEATGQAGIGEACSQAATCQPKMACFSLTGEPTSTCHQFCITDDDCPQNRLCNQNVNFQDGATATFCSDIAVGCSAFNAGSCPEGQACYFNNGATKCLPAGGLALGEPCKDSGANACTPGLQCLIVCTAICATKEDGEDQPKCSATCDGAPSVVDAANGIGMCIGPDPPQECELYEQLGCPAGEACYPTTLGWECLSAGDIPDEAACQFTNDCEPGTICVNGACAIACSLKPDAAEDSKCSSLCGASSGLSPTQWGVGFCTAP